VKILRNLFIAGPKFIRSLNSAISDAYNTLAELLNNSTNNPLKDEIRKLFNSLIELRLPIINNFLKDNKTARHLLKEANIIIPELETFESLLIRAEDLRAEPLLDTSSLITDKEIASFCKDWKSLMINQSNAYKLNEGFLMITVNALAKIADFSWNLFETQQSKEKHKVILQSIFGMWEWLVKKNVLVFEVSLIDWMMGNLTKSLMPSPEKQRDELLGVGILLQRILALLLQANDGKINEVLEVINFGETFGKQLQLQYEGLKQSQINKDPPYDNYPEQNNLRLNAFKSLIASNSIKLRSQFLKSEFIEKAISEYVKDKRKFTSKFEKIDLKFLAFKQWYPLRSEAIGFIEEALKAKYKAPEIYAEIMQRIDIHLLIAHECKILEYNDMEEEFLVQSALHLLTMILRETAGNKRNERVAEVVFDVMGKKPILRLQFNELTKFL